MKKILILNTGGTLNKVYNPLTGALDVPSHNGIIEEILHKSMIKNVTVEGLIFKDSLDMTQNDRDDLVQKIKATNIDNIIIVHGTDTMDQTANYLQQHICNKTILFTGAMKPYSIEPVEATANLLSAYGFLMANTDPDIYICMHGLIKPHQKVFKNRSLGVFECH
ncbi:MAG: asparaginase [Campylobacterales bacterium]|nr:asparaginase [Campylobacterales bacterium]